MQGSVKRATRISLLASIAATLAAGFCFAQSPATPAAPATAVEQALQNMRAGKFEEVMTLIRQLAEQGNANAQLVLADAYDKGRGVVQDDEQAADWYGKAAAQGVANAQNSFGVALANGRGVSPDPGQALVWYRKAAEQGSAAAEANLGLAYWNGEGVSRDDATAAMWFRRAAEHGLGWGQYYLGSAYESGRGVLQDDALAVEWFGKAAEQGYAVAESDLGSMYAAGRGVARDYGRAVFWFAKAARHGDQRTAKRLRAALARLPVVRMRMAAEVREKPESSSALIATVATRGTARELSRSGSWVEVYLQERHTVGYVSVDMLELRK